MSLTDVVTWCDVMTEQSVDVHSFCCYSQSILHGSDPETHLFHHRRPPSVQPLARWWGSSSETPSAEDSRLILGGFDAKATWGAPFVPPDLPYLSDATENRRLISRVFFRILSRNMRTFWESTGEGTNSIWVACAQRYPSAVRVGLHTGVTVPAQQISVTGKWEWGSGSLQQRCLFGAAIQTLLSLTAHFAYWLSAFCVRLSQTVEAASLSTDVD